MKKGPLHILGNLLRRDKNHPTDSSAAAPEPDKTVISFVIGSYNRRPLLEKTIDSIRTNGIEVPFEIIVIDGGSSDGTMEWLIGQKDVITIVQHNRGEFRGKPIKRRSWGYFMNLGFKAAGGKYILMLSDDCLLLPGAVNKGLETFSLKEAEGAKIGGVAFYFRNWPMEEKYYVQRTLGGKLLINHGMFLRQAMEEIGWADEDRYIFYKADGDLCLRIWEAGYEIVDCPEAVVEHYFDEGEEVRQSNSNIVMDHDRVAYLKRWEGIFYHPGKSDPRGPVYIDFRDAEETAARAWGNANRETAGITDAGKIPVQNNCNDRENDGPIERTGKSGKEIAGLSSNSANSAEASLGNDPEKPHGLNAFISDNPGILAVCATAILFHLMAYFTVKSFYSTHLPHYDSMGAYEVMFRIIDKVHQAGYGPALKLASAHFLSWFQSFIALIGAPVLSKTPESLQLYNSLCVFLFMGAVYAAAKSAGAGNLRAYLLSLIVFLPDTFYNWQGGLLDLQRDPSFVSLLGATYFMFFAYAWKPATAKGIQLGVLAGLAVISRGNAIYLLAGIMFPILLIWAIARFRSRDYSPVLRLFLLAGVPFSILAVPNIYYTFASNLQRQSDPYTFFIFGRDPWTSLATYWTMPFKIVFGSSYATVYVTAAVFGLIGAVLAALRIKGLISIDRSFLTSRSSMGMLLSGLWLVVSILFLMCIVLKYIPYSYEAAKHPFYPVLLGFLSAFFIFGLSVNVNTGKMGRVWVKALTAGLCLAIFLSAAARVGIKTGRDTAVKAHNDIARKLVDLFSEPAKSGKVAYIWHDTISIDTLNYYLAQEGKEKIKKFTYKTSEGHNLDFAVGTPPGTDVEALLATMKKQIEEDADFVVVNINPGAYAANDKGMFIFRYGQPVIDSIVKNNKFKVIYEYELWDNKPWGGRFAVLENLSRRGKVL